LANLLVRIRKPIGTELLDEQIMKTRPLFIATAVLEIGAGVA
jgi:hypothetical protein